MANKHETLKDLFTEIADAIRSKTGSTSTIVADDFPNAISDIVVNSGSNTDFSVVTAGAGDVRSPKYFLNSSGVKTRGTLVTKTSSNVTTNANKVIIPAGIYDSQVTKTVATATQATPSITVSESGLITATSTQSTSGYITAGTQTETQQLTTQAKTSIKPSTSSQTAVASGVYTTGEITVEAIPSSYVQPTTTKIATTYTPTTSNQTIAAGTYCSGTQTIKGDSNLKATNIVKGVSIFGVIGTAEAGSGSGNSWVTNDPNLQPEYIKSGVTIGGVTGVAGVFRDQTVSVYVDDEYCITVPLTNEESIVNLGSVYINSYGGAYGDAIDIMYLTSMYRGDYSTSYFKGFIILADGTFQEISTDNNPFDLTEQNLKSIDVNINGTGYYFGYGVQYDVYCCYAVGGTGNS
jgi:hypothetical protein